VASTRATFGFLYEDYGSSAWWWEVEELLRKLLLSAVVVLIDEGSPLQVTLAVLVSGWAHVLHAQYKPWGAGSVLYSLQHGALFVTSFVFLMGLLFKVDGVSSSSGTYSALSGIMVTLCAVFMAAWVAVIAARVAAMWRVVRRSQSRKMTRRGVQARTGPEAAGVDGDEGTARAMQATTVAGNGSAVDGEVSGNLGSASSTSVRPSDGFVVVNPLRLKKTDGAGPGAAAAAAAAGGAAAVPCDVVAADLQEPNVCDAHNTLAVSRLQRVLAAQQPVPTSTR
jgi:hypothetical protein